MIELEGVPELVDPVMVAAFEGWNDAGDAASTAVTHLEREWKGEVFAALDAEDYYDFQVNRPQVWLDGGARKITWPTTRLSVVRVEDADGKGRQRDLVLVRGIEPSMRWRSFCNEILGFAHELGVELVVVMGALLGDTPHTRPVPVTGVTSDPDLARTMNLEESSYEGPTGIVGILQEACTHAGVPAATLWASVPHYVSQPPNPKATLALLNKLEDLLSVRVPLGELPEDARAWQLGVDQLAAEDSEVAEYVQSLEEASDTAELPEASGEAIAKEFERYLRRRDGSAEQGGGAGASPFPRDAGRQPPSRKPTGEPPMPDTAEQSGAPEEARSENTAEDGAQSGDAADGSPADERAADRDAGDESAGGEDTGAQGRTGKSTTGNGSTGKGTTGKGAKGKKGGGRRAAGDPDAGAPGAEGPDSTGPAAKPSEESEGRELSGKSEEREDDGPESGPGDGSHGPRDPGGEA